MSVVETWVARWKQPIEVILPLPIDVLPTLCPILFHVKYFFMEMFLISFLPYVTVNFAYGIVGQAVNFIEHTHDKLNGLVLGTDGRIDGASYRIK